MKKHCLFFLCIISICYFMVLLQYWQGLIWNRHGTIIDGGEFNTATEVEFYERTKKDAQTSRRINQFFLDADSLSQFIVEKTKRYADDDSAGLLSALLVGRKHYISIAMKDIARRSGASHLLALSGFHLQILLYFLFRLKGLLPFFWQSMISLILVWGYCFYLGFIPSLYRAAVMFTLAVLSRLLWGNVSFISLWSVTTVIMIALVSNPLNNVALVLSQLALLGVVYGRAMCIPKSLDTYIAPAILESIGVGLGALIATAWYSFFVFKAVYPVSVMSAIILSPLIIVFILFGVLFLMIPSVLAMYVGAIVQWLSSIIRIIMSYASSIVSIDSFKELIGFYVLIGILLLFTLYFNKRTLKVKD